MATEILSLTEVGSGDADKFLSHNQALREIEAHTVRAISRTNGGPPVSPNEGDVYIVDSATGDWASGSVHDIAHYYGGAWYFYTPVEGVRLWINDADSLQVFDGTDWDSGVGGGISGFTQGSVVFISPSGTATEDNANFFWDDTNNRLGLGGETSPEGGLHIIGVSGRTQFTSAIPALTLEGGADEQHVTMFLRNGDGGIIGYIGAKVKTPGTDAASSGWLFLTGKEVGVAGAAATTVIIDGKGNIHSGVNPGAGYGGYEKIMILDDSTGSDAGYSLGYGGAYKASFAVENVGQPMIETTDQFWINHSSNANPKVRVLSTGFTGINLGASSPSYDLDVAGNAIQVGTGTDGFVQFKSSAGNWHFGAETGNQVTLYSGTYGAGTQQVTVDTVGVGIGFAAPVTKLDVNGNIRIFSTAADSSLVMRAPSTYDAFIGFAEATVADRGVFGFAGGSSTFSYRSAAFDMVTGTERMSIDTNGDMDLPTGGIKLNGGTDILEEYDVGTWTPVLADAASAGNTATFTNNEASYTRIGRQVTIHYDFSSIDTTGMTGANNLFITGLPFTVNTGAVSAFQGPVLVENITISDAISSQAEPNTTYFRILESNTGAGLSVIIVSDITSGSGRVAGTFTYYV